MKQNSNKAHMVISVSDDGDKFDAGTILRGIIIASIKSINEPLEEELDE